jgi:hypothetical protein
VPSLGSWVNIRTSAGTRRLADALSMSNVTVNFYTAVDPHIHTMEKIAPSIEDIPPSICIGTYRLVVHIDDSNDDGNTTDNGTIVHFRAICGLTLTPEESSDTSDSGVPNALINGDNSVIRKRTSAFVTMPISISKIPSMLRIDGPSAIEQSLSIAVSPRNMNIIKWVIGNSLLGNIGPPKFVYFWGKGGDGKSSTINTILSALPGCSSPLSMDYLGKPGINISNDDLDRMVSMRIVTYGDSVLKDGYLCNTSFMRKIAGGDAITTERMIAKVECSAFMAGNMIWYPARELMEPWYARRVIILMFNSLPPNLPPPRQQFNDMDMLQFATSCVITRMKLRDPPIDVETALVTLFSGKVIQKTRAIVFKDPSMISPVEGLGATITIAVLAKLDVKQLLNLVSKMNPSLIEHSSNPYIRGVGLAKTSWA